MKKTRGFTLIEVLIALLILAGAVIVLSQSWGGSMRAVRKARAYSTVTFLLQKKVVEFEVTNKDKTVEELKEEDHGDFGSEYPDFKWEIKLKPFAVPNIFPAQGGDQDELVRTILKVMADYFEKAVREVQVTVLYTRGENTQKYSLTTLFVDYSKEIPSGF